MAEKDDILAEAREAFDLAVDAENENREAGLDDVRFARLAEQWPDEVKTSRAGRPMLTINRLPSFIRQVVNDARQNKPSIKVHPVDSGADPETAEVINGLIRNIEVISNADVAYDTGAENAISNGWGYWKVDLDYAHDDTFDMDLLIKRVANPFSIYGDPHSTAADSSDWNSAFEVDWVPHKTFEAEYGEEVGKVDWTAYGSGLGPTREQWVNDKEVLVAKRWKREEVKRKIVLLDDGQILDAKGYAEAKDLFDAMGLTVKQERETRSWKVKRYVMTGEDILNGPDGETWPGVYIPIVPVYGDEVWVEGKRYLRSLVRDAKDPQRMFNYWRSAATELVALAPRVPYLAEEGSIVNPGKWATANNANHAYLEYAKGRQMPQRQPLDVGPAAGALQEALNATDDMKSIMGLYDASLGARSNETSGVAINARKKEGDVSTFHFPDNVSRAIRHTGRILIDLVPKVYNQERIIRVMGEDGAPKNVPLQQPVPVMDEQTGQPMMEAGPVDPMTGQPTQQPVTRVYDLTAGKYDLTVSTGPSYTTQREEARETLMALAQASPDIVQKAGDLIVKNMDFPGADELAKRLEPGAMGLPPQVQQQIEEGQQRLQQLEQENQQLKADGALKAKELEVKDKELQIKGMEVHIKEQELQIKRFEASTDRIQALKPEPQPMAPQGQF